MKRPFSLTIKQSPVVIVRNFLIMEIAGYVAFLFLGILADYGRIYGELPWGMFLSYQNARFSGIVFFEIVLTFFIFFDWFYTYYKITGGAVVWSRGVLWRKKITAPIDSVILASAEYGLLGKVFGYGTLKITMQTGGEIKLRWIKRPQKYAGLIVKLKEMSGKNSGRSGVFHCVSDPADLVHREESEQLEFKSTLRWDTRAGEASRHVEKAVMKTIAAFLNSDGGHLVIGIDDEHSVIGLERDYSSLRRQDRDGFENHFTNVFNSVIGAEFRQSVRLHFPKVQDKEMCVIEVSPAARPVFLRFDNSEEFYIRTGNSTTSLKLSEAAAYLESWKIREG